jgi:lipoate-protein ligase B
MVPCGIAEVEMTSVAREAERRDAGAASDGLREQVRTLVAGSFADVFALDASPVDRAALERLATPALAAT